MCSKGTEGTTFLEEELETMSSYSTQVVPEQSENLYILHEPFHSLKNVVDKSISCQVRKLYTIIAEIF